jgi:hypothetical protein
MIKSITVSLIGEKNAGRLDYLLKRKPKSAWGVLNGQAVRQKVYSEIMDRIDFRAIVETGTYRGTTSEFFAESGLPVYTVEIHPRLYGYAVQRFSGDHRVHVFHGDSPAFLRGLADDPKVSKSKVFFYLDAHVQDGSRYHKAPLQDELEIVFTRWNDAVVLVDDFQVPGTGYGFDDWGPGKTLSVECLQPLKHLNLSAFFPAVDVDQETGAKRGWVVLCKEDNVRQILSGIDKLRPYILQ